MTTATTNCIHGVPTQHCVSCRTCAHGQPSWSCVRCRSASAAKKTIEPIGDQSTHQHAGYDIFYELAVSGWRFRAPDASASPLSYRSAFLARKAVDARVQGVTDAPTAPRGKSKGKGKARGSVSSPSQP